MANFDDLGIAPDYGATERSRPNVQSVKFGDGFEARYAFGLNTNPKTWDLTFALRDEDDATAITDFLDEQGAVTAFEWTPPGASGTSNFICRDWTKSQPKPGLFTVQAVFEQVYDP